MPTRPALLQRAVAVRRDRVLAGDERAGAWTKARVRERWLDFVRLRWRLLAAMALSAGALTTLAALLAPNDFLRGVIVGGMAVGTVVALMVLVAQATGTGTMSQGAAAESLTPSELRPLLKHGWRLINHVSLRPSDIDHVLVGPAGVIAVETKWSATPWDVRQPSPWLRRAAQQAQNNAADLQSWAPIAKHAVKVWPTVMLWNAATPGSAPADQVYRIDGTAVVHGRAAIADWRDSVLAAEPVLDRSTVDAIVGEIDRHLRRRDERGALEHPPLPTLQKAYWTLLSSVVAFTVAALVSLYALTLSGSWWVWSAVTAAECTLGLLAPSRVPRIVKIAWLVGAGSVAALSATAAVVQLF